jgi:hypothetical protein
MFDLTKADPHKLPAHELKLREWELMIERAANEAQKRVDESEVLNGRSLVQRLLTERKPQP